MLDYNSTTLSFASANFTALFEEHSQCPFTISNVYLPDLTSNLSTKQIASLITYKSKKLTLVVDSIDLEAKFTNLGALYPTKLEFVVEGQLDADVTVQTNVTITVDFTTLKTAIEAVLSADEEAKAAKRKKEKDDADALEEEIKSNKRNKI